MAESIPSAAPEPTPADVRSTFTAATPPVAPVPESSPEPVAQPTPTPVPEPTPSFSFLNYAKEQGIDLGEIGDDKTAAEAFLTNWRQMQGWIAQQQVQQPSPEPEPQKPAEEEWSLDGHFAKAWGVPNRDPQWDDIIASGIIVKDPDTGQYVPRPGLNSWMSVNPKVLQDINAYEQSYGRSAREFLADPLRKTYEALVEVFDRRYAKPETVTQTLEDRTVEQVASQFEQQHGAWLKTADGERFLKLVSAFRATMPPMQAMQEALLYVSPPQTAQPTPAESESAATPAAMPAPAPTPEQISAQKQESFLQDAKRRASHSSSGGVPPSAPEDTGTMSGEDVRTLFTRTARKQVAAGR